MQKVYKSEAPEFPSLSLDKQFILYQADIRSGAIAGQTIEEVASQIQKVSPPHSDAVATIHKKMLEANELELNGAQKSVALVATGLVSPGSPHGSQKKETNKSQSGTPTQSDSSAAKATTSEKWADGEESDSGSDESNDSSSDGSSEDDGILSATEAETDRMEYSEIVGALSIALQFKGFNPKAIRKACKVNGGKALVRQMMTYIYCGNNYVERLKKVEDKSIGRDLVKEFRRSKIRTSRGDSSNTDVLVLSRIATAHMPLLLLLRKKLAQSGTLPPAQFGSACPLEWQDLSLAGMPGKPDGYQEYYVQFGKALYDADPDRSGMTDEQVRAESISWIVKCENGYKADTEIHDFPTGPRQLNALMKRFGYE